MADDIFAVKRALRREMLAARRSMTEGDAATERSSAVREHLVDALAERFVGIPHYGAPRSAPQGERSSPGDRQVLRHVLAYDAGPGEVELGPLLDALRSGGIEVALPAATPRAVPPVPPSWPDVIIVPGVAFDSSGGRLGRGGGWYDRLLGDPERRALTVGVAFAFQMVRSVPLEEHDVRVDLVVTERGVE